MPYAIMRCSKLKTPGGVVAALQHNFRERDTPNADPALTPTNQHLHAISTNEAMGKLRSLLPIKHRKDAVLAVEYLMTASPEWWQTATPQQQDAFFSRSMDWLADKYGAVNIIAATIQRDEKTPHLSAFVVPKTADGRLSAKEFIGNRHLMRHDQTSFAEKVKDLGLERGIEGSKARHQRVQQHYGLLNRAPFQKPPHLPPDHLLPQVVEKRLFKNVVETPEAVAQRISATLHKHYTPAFEQAAISTQNARRAKEMEQTAKAKSISEKTLKERLNKIEGFSKPLYDLARVDRDYLNRLLAAAKAKLTPAPLQHKHERNRGRSR
jgi:membrane-bound lytic murein transglycosylase B